MRSLIASGVLIVALEFASAVVGIVLNLPNYPVTLLASLIAGGLFAFGLAWAIHRLTAAPAFFPRMEYAFEGKLWHLCP